MPTKAKPLAISATAQSAAVYPPSGSWRDSCIAHIAAERRSGSCTPERDADLAFTLAAIIVGNAPTTRVVQ